MGSPPLRGNGFQAACIVPEFRSLERGKDAQQSAPISTAGGLTRSTFYRGEQKVEERFLCPIACVAGVGRQKGAVTSVPGLDQHDTGVGAQFGASVGSQADERIVESLQDQRGHSDVLRPVGTGNAMVVVVRTGGAAVSRDDLFVKLAHGANLTEAIGGVEIGVEFNLLTKVLEHFREKPALVKAVLRLMQCGGGGSQIHEWRDTDNGLEIGRYGGAQLSGQL